jgi:hypothetical protein
MFKVKCWSIYHYQVCSRVVDGSEDISFSWKCDFLFLLGLFLYYSNSFCVIDDKAKRILRFPNPSMGLLYQYQKLCGHWDEVVVDMTALKKTTGNFNPESTYNLCHCPIPLNLDRESANQPQKTYNCLPITEPRKPGILIQAFQSCEISTHEGPTPILTIKGTNGHTPTDVP